MKKALVFYLLMISAFAAFAQNRIHPNLYKIVVLNGGFSGTYINNIQKKYIALYVYLVNNSHDTLKYCGTDCLYTKFFSISKNRYLYLGDQDSKKQPFTKYVVPPHRSQKIAVLLSEKKAPDTIVNLKVNMKLFRWINGNYSNLDNKYLISKLSDNVTIKFNKNHNEYSDKQDSEIEQQKEKNIPPDLQLHFLTPNERKLYRLTIDQKEISKPHDSLIYHNKKVIVFNVPVLLKNNSNDTLKFLTMTCSWYWDFHIDNNIHFVESLCFSNFPTDEIILPHGNFLRTIPVYIYQGQFKRGTKFKVGMSLTLDNNTSFLEYYPFKSHRFNLIWSNEVTVP